jgi:hypothetical protein
MQGSSTGSAGTEFSRTISKIVWIEPNDTKSRSARGRLVRQADGFLDIYLVDGRLLRIRQDCLIKIEECDACD